MDIKEFKKELNLVCFGYDEENKAFLTKMDNSMVIREFSKILDKLESHKISYSVVNMSYIKVDF